MEFFFNSILEQSWYFFFLSGIMLILLGLFFRVFPKTIRELHHLRFVSLAFLFYGTSKLLLSFHIVTGNPHLHVGEKFFQLLCIHMTAEFMRKNWKKAFGFSVSAFVHIPIFIIFTSTLVFLGDLFFGYGGIPTILLLLTLCFEFYRGAKTGTHPQVKNSGLMLAGAIVILLAQFVPSLAGEIPIFEEVPRQLDSVVTIAHILQLIIIISICFLIFLIKTIVNFRDPRAQNSQVWKNLASGLFIILLVLTNFFGAFLSNILIKRENKQLKVKLERSKESLEKLIDQRIVFATTSSRLISSTPIMGDYIENPDEKNRKILTNFLNNFSQNFPDGNCYLMDKTGLVLNSSGKQELFVGKYLNFRSYFKEAIAGKNGRLIDYGKFTNELGFYSAHPVFSTGSGDIIGVCAVKRNLNDLSNFFRLYHPSLLLDRSGKIFLASKIDYVGKEIRFPEDELPFIKGTYLKSEMNPGQDQFVVSKKQFLYSFVDLGLGGWKVILLRSSDELYSTRIWTFSFFALLSLILITFFLGNLRKTEILEGLQLAKRQFEAVFYNAPEGILIVSPKDLKILSANVGLERLFELKTNPEGRFFKELLPPQGLNFNKVSHDFARKSFLHERNFARNDETIFTAEVNGAATIYNGEKAILLFLRDVSPRIKFEQKLREAKEEAEKANQIKSRFLANTSHEIRTPMTAILGLNELARKMSNSDKQFKLLNLVSESTRYLLELLNDILDLSQIETGNFRLETKAFPLKKMLNQLMQIARLRADEKNIQATLEIGGNIPDFVVSDPFRIRQVLMNLLNNALNYTSEGKVSLAVNMFSEFKNKLKLEFIIKDTGEGIPKEVQEGLFAPFAQTSTNSGELRGSALCLSICKQLVEILDGKISVESSVGAGTTFKLHITVERAESKEISQLKKPIENSNILLSTKGIPLKVLVADDNETNLFLASSIISEYKGESDCVKDGMEALNMLKEKTYDVILLDIQMPNLDGIEAMKRIRQSQQSYSMVPIIALSAFSTNEEKEKALQAGANHYLMKPYFPNDLLASIKQVFPKPLDLPQATAETNDNGQLQSAESSNTFLSKSLKQIDLKELEFRILKKAENILQIKEIFSRRSTTLVESLSECIKEENSQKLMETAHSIKGLSGMLAANMTYKRSLEIEQLARDKKFQQAIELVPVLVSQINEIAADLEIICENIKKN